MVRTDADSQRWRLRMDVLIPPDRIAVRIDELAVEIARTYAGKKITVVGILTGSLLFLADLVRRMDLSIQIGLLKANSYRGTATTPGKSSSTTPACRMSRAGTSSCSTTFSIPARRSAKSSQHLHDRGAASVRTCVLLRKIGRQVVPFEPDFTGFEIPNKFVIGYGLDYDDEYRHLPFIGVLPDAPDH